MAFKITILGSSGAVPAYGRMPSAQFIEVENNYFMIDCAEGAQLQLMKFDLHMHRIDHIFISHLHGDHYLGLMGLIFTLHLNKRKNDLHIYSHKGLDEIIMLQLKYSKSSLNYKIIFHQLTPGKQEVVFENKFVTVETIPLLHKLDCSGFLIREKLKPRRIDKEVMPQNLSILQLNKLKAGEDIVDEEGNILYKNESLTLSPRKSRSYAYCSDTQYFEDIVEQIREVDVLYHEATFMEEDADKALETRHSTVKQAATIAVKARSVRLLIGHFSARYKDLLPVIDEAKRVFQNTYLALEGETFTIED
ncbi:MAG TPA: ribonuclease Z [Cyclobacteriaceae bacterium]|nr:ribonuclease Z [Cyclobacteriaceae bacterium]HMV09357.1 ribonuclease Z [Cyclobacteriaceae bacterium]HMV91186.1 ribonuclease Z [Cyclobacteriaceae bacterium]HMX00994.1 ribonuclease Z [Cyclobacteriaceae bacterium]HMX51134.1 ribonuclease Z [Cyclobacteriaceae bacterium]